jgi:hypothetical protein
MSFNPFLAVRTFDLDDSAYLEKHKDNFVLPFRQLLPYTDRVRNFNLYPGSRSETLSLSISSAFRRTGGAPEKQSIITRAPMRKDSPLKVMIVKAATLVLVTAACAMALDFDARAETDGEDATRWGKVRLQGVLILPLADNRVEGWNDCGPGWIGFLNFYTSIDANRAGGIHASFEYVLKRRYGIEAGLAYWSDIVSIYFTTNGTTVEGSPNFIMPVIGLNYHFLTDDRKDIYAGPTACLGVMATGLGVDIEVSKDVALGLKAGMDYYFKESWSLGAALQYIDFGELDFSLLPPGLSGIICNNGLFGIGSLNFVSLTCGVGYRF